MEVPFPAQFNVDLGLTWRELWNFNFCLCFPLPIKYPLCQLTTQSCFLMKTAYISLNCIEGDLCSVVLNLGSERGRDVPQLHANSLYLLLSSTKNCPH